MTRNKTKEINEKQNEWFERYYLNTLKVDQPLIWLIKK